MSSMVVAALYQFAPLDSPPELQKALRELCEASGIRGTLLLSHEGINGTVAGTRTAIDELHQFLQTHFNALEYKESWADEMPFHRMKVLIKKEIVTLGVEGVDPCKNKGTYVQPEDWNTLISDPDVLVLDVRNDYEVQIGSFQRAVNPNTLSFREFPGFVEGLDKTKHPKVAMFCTGGIRCEKASSYMLSQGFEDVYHLKGGILKYLETVPSQESLWNGECFVFDGRVSVKHGLDLGSYDLCHGCRQPLSDVERNSPLYEAGVCCPNCAADLPPERVKAFRERHRQELLARKRGEQHIGYRKQKSGVRNQELNQPLDF